VTPLSWRIRTQFNLNESASLARTPLQRVQNELHTISFSRNKPSRTGRRRKLQRELINSFESALAGTNDDPNFSIDAPQYRVQPARAEHYTVTESREAQRRRDARAAFDPAKEVNRAVVNSERKI
jgi:hypothetical protein